MKKVLCHVALSAIFLLLLSSCSDIQKRNLADADLAQRSASVLGATQEHVVISQRQAVSKNTLLFTATVNGQRNRCTISTQQWGLRLSKVQCLRHM